MKTYSSILKKQEFVRSSNFIKRGEPTMPILWLEIEEQTACSRVISTIVKRAPARKRFHRPTTYRENGCSMVASRRIVLQLEHKPWLKQIKLFSSTLYSWGGPLRLTVECLEGWVDLFQTDMKFEEKIEGKNLHAIVSKDARCFVYLNARRVSIIISFYVFRKHIVTTMKFTW